MTNNDELTARLIKAASGTALRTAKWDPTKGRTRPRTTHKRKNIR